MAGSEGTRAQNVRMFTQHRPTSTDIIANYEIWPFIYFLNVADSVRKNKQRYEITPVYEILSQKIFNLTKDGFPNTAVSAGLGRVAKYM